MPLPLVYPTLKRILRVEFLVAVALTCFFVLYTRWAPLPGWTPAWVAADLHWIALFRWLPLIVMPFALLAVWFGATKLAPFLVKLGIASWVYWNSAPPMPPSLPMQEMPEPLPWRGMPEAHDRPPSAVSFSR